MFASLLRSRPVHRLWLVLGVLALIAFALFPDQAFARETDLSILDPASPNAKIVADLYWIIFWLAVAVFILVEGALFWSAIKFRRRSDDELPVQIHGNTRWEIIWTIGPALLTLGIFILSLQTMWAIEQPAANAVAIADAQNVCFVGDVAPERAAQFLGTSTMEVQIFGNQWWWEYNYPAFGFFTAADMVVPVGAIVKLQMRSRDVAHAWWIPRLGGKQDLYPDEDTFTWFQATQEGTFEGHCTELCGASHAYMPMRVIALSQEKFDAWVQKHTATAALPPAGSQEEKGMLTFKKYCQACHNIPGVTERETHIGPSLQGVFNRTLIGGILDMDPNNLEKWIKNAPSVKPGSKMPAFANLTDDEVQALVAYLRTQQ